MAQHIGRSWQGHPLEDACPCDQTPCGLVSTDYIHPDCTQHHWRHAKTIRQQHHEDDCPNKHGDGG